MGSWDRRVEVKYRGGGQGTKEMIKGSTKT
jgi:hypothetical protein